MLIEHINDFDFDCTQTLAEGETKTPSKTSAEDRPKDDWFDTWRIASGPALKSAVGAMRDAFDFHEQHTMTRKRARKAEDLETLDCLIEMIVSNLAWQVYSPASKGALAYSRTNNKARSRYQHPRFSSKMFVRVIDALREFDVVHLTLGEQRFGGSRGVASTMRATDWYKRQLEDFGVSLADVGRDPDEELVVLSRAKRDFKGDRAGTEYVEYQDTPDTHRFRAEVREINTFLREADIAFLDDGLGPVDTGERRLRRHFSVYKDETQRFDQHGRLFGGFWINLKSHRREHIRINGEGCVDLDFANMFMSLAYAQAGVPRPAGDLYDLTGYLNGYAENPSVYRKGVKSVFNAALFGGGQQKLPKGTKADTSKGARKVAHPGEDVKRLPPGTKLEDIRKAFMAKHPALKDIWGSNAGMGFYRTESDILVAILLRLKKEGVVALGTHDGMLVPKSALEQAKAAMEEVSEEHLGFPLTVNEKPFRDPQVVNSH